MKSIFYSISKGFSSKGAAPLLLKIWSRGGAQTLSMERQSLHLKGALPTSACNLSLRIRLKHLH